MSSNTQEYTERLQHWAIIPLSPQMKTKNQRRARSNADFLFSFAPPRRRRGGMSERLRRDEIPERGMFAGGAGMWAAGPNPGERGTSYQTGRENGRKQIDAIYQIGNCKNYHRALKVFCISILVAKTSFSLSIASYRQVKMCSKKTSTHAPISGWLFKIRFLSKLPAS